jgi:hypothetical protein
MILPEWRACGFSNLERVIKNEFNALPAKCVLHTDIRARKVFVDTGSRLLRCSLLLIVSWHTHHLMSCVLAGGELLVLTWNWKRTRCYASVPVAEMLSCTVPSVRVLFIECDTVNYLGSSELLKIWCFVQDICTHLVNLHLNFVRKHWIEILRFICASLTEVEVIMSIDDGGKNNSDVVPNLCQN